jgi:hypothetical protein
MASNLADAQASAILDQVELHSLKATPGTIVPFAASAISWNVSGPGGFELLLGTSQVHKVGEKLVTPLATKAFPLSARAGRITQVLGTVVVTVDQAACRIVPVPNLVVEQFVREGIEQVIAENPGTTRRRDDKVTIDPAGIAIDLALKKAVKFKKKGVEITINFEVDIDAHWRYRVANGQLFADFITLDASVSAPWWAWLIPLSYPGLPIAIAIAKDGARSSIRKKAANGAEALEFFVEDGLRLLSAQFTPTNFEMFACPDAALRKLLVPGAPSLEFTRSS